MPNDDEETPLPRVLYDPSRANPGAREQADRDLARHEARRQAIARKRKGSSSMQNQAVIIVLTVLMNTLGGITAMSLFKPGSVAFLVVSIAGLVVGNALAIFGRPAVGKSVAITEETPKV
jgi:hypothetical protein